VVIQAAVGNKIIARETIKPFRKDVLAKLHASDITRRRKLLEKQKEGRKRLRAVGKEIAGLVIEIPPTSAALEVVNNVHIKIYKGKARYRAIHLQAALSPSETAPCRPRA
jgi:hypothetical protein